MRASAFPITAAQEIRLQPSEGNNQPPPPNSPPSFIFHNLELFKSLRFLFLFLPITPSKMSPLYVLFRGLVSWARLLALDNCITIKLIQVRRKGLSLYYYRRLHCCDTTLWANVVTEDCEGKMFREAPLQGCHCIT